MHTANFYIFCKSFSCKQEVVERETDRERGWERECSLTFITCLKRLSACPLSRQQSVAFIASLCVCECVCTCHDQMSLMKQCWFPLLIGWVTLVWRCCATTKKYINKFYGAFGNVPGRHCGLCAAMFRLLHWCCQAEGFKHKKKFCHVHMGCIFWITSCLSYIKTLKLKLFFCYRMV